MGREYLNAQNRNDVLIFTHVGFMLDKRIKEFEKYNKKTTNLKYAHTYIQKFIKHTTKDLEHNFKIKLVADIAETGLAISTKKEVLRDMDKLKKNPDYMLVETDDFLNMAGALMETTCQRCRAGREQADKCIIKNLFIKHDIAIYDNHTENCPYQYSKEDKEDGEKNEQF